MSFFGASSIAYNCKLSQKSLLSKNSVLKRLIVPDLAEFWSVKMAIMLYIKFLDSESEISVRSSDTFSSRSQVSVLEEASLLVGETSFLLWSLAPASCFFLFLTRSS